MTVKDRLESSIGRIDRRRLASWLLAGAGLVLAAVVPDVAESVSRGARLGMTLVGGVAIFGGMVWDAVLQYETGPIDERMAEIRYRAAWVAMYGLLATTVTLQFATIHTDVELSMQATIWTATALTFAVFFGAQWVYRWTM